MQRDRHGWRRPFGPREIMVSRWIAMAILASTIAIVAIHYARQPHHPRDWARERDPQGQYPECAPLYTDECVDEALAQRTRASLDLANRALRLQAEAAARR